jgi:hypothetical protein
MLTTNAICQTIRLTVPASHEEHAPPPPPKYTHAYTHTQSINRKPFPIICIYQYMDTAKNQTEFIFGPNFVNLYCRESCNNELICFLNLKFVVNDLKILGWGH